MDRKEERFAVVSETNEVLALWCSFVRSPRDLEGVLAYRLDRFEVAPRFRGTDFSPRCLGLVASRAIEAQCQTMVLWADAVFSDYYGRAGATQRLPAGWQENPPLLPFIFEPNALSFLKELADAHIQT